ncbi:hypothetical protein [Dactylosporangium sp. CA-233914]|uniref:hypothetical protein n=1 Tax=Dactylosporangium sp. CA-233914 TaxID=3239934 RepID=UPI003D8A5421
MNTLATALAAGRTDVDAAMVRATAAALAGGTAARSSLRQQVRSVERELTGEIKLQWIKWWYQTGRRFPQNSPLLHSLAASMADRPPGSGG